MYRCEREKLHVNHFWELEEYSLVLSSFWCFLLDVGKEPWGLSSQPASPARVPRSCQPPPRKCAEGPRGNNIIPDEYECPIRKTLEWSAACHGEPCGDLEKTRKRTQRSESVPFTKLILLFTAQLTLQNARLLLPDYLNEYLLYLL